MKNLNDFILHLNNTISEKNGMFFCKNHKKIWELSYLPSQENKAKEFNLPEEIKTKAFNTLINRGRIIAELFEYFDFKTFCEVGTAEGYQHFIIADQLKKNETKEKSYTCDIRDVRNKNLLKEYEDNCEFILGTSKELAKHINNKNKKIDLFWIDGDHRNGAVLKDVLRLTKVQSKNCIWVFDDFNKRFGSFNELQFLSLLENSVVINMGITASGQPNSILLIQGEL